jgi:hypothetical protein
LQVLQVVQVVQVVQVLQVLRSCGLAVLHDGAKRPDLHDISLREPDRLKAVKTAIRQLAESKTSPPPASVLRNYFIHLKAGFPVSHSPSFLFLVAPLI